MVHKVWEKNIVHLAHREQLAEFNFRYICAPSRRNNEKENKVGLMEIYCSLIKRKPYPESERKGIPFKNDLL